ncbi:MAG TPA: type II toxin-antitoxin system RelE/ParE family toxin [Candidatus Campbellbacteria bacterium]|nr:type II toxin-antitoxin system RelE/ParE family toxin [Candidatus Campbellbacteria bacterium]
MKFIEKENITEGDVVEVARKTILKFQGEDLNVDIKKLKGKWTGFYRIRIGKLRIIAEFNFDNFSVLIEEIDWRGRVY